MINLILCGGSGTRLWPISRTLMPKQYKVMKFTWKKIGKHVVKAAMNPKLKHSIKYDVGSHCQ